MRLVIWVYMIVFNPLRGILAAALAAHLHLSLSFFFHTLCVLVSTSLALCVCRQRLEAPGGSLGGLWKQWFARICSDAVYLRNWHGVGAPCLLRGTQRFTGLAERFRRQALARQNTAKTRLPAVPWLGLDLHTDLNISPFPAVNNNNKHFEKFF